MIDSIGNTLPIAPGPRTDEAQEKAAAQTHGGADDRADARVQAEASALASARPAAPAPDRVDPEIWTHLSSEERDYFARVEALGAVTYGRGAQAQPASVVARGTHLDIRG